MSEPIHEDSQREAGDPAEAAVAGLDGLETLPVAEHVAVFEQAHAELRRALDAQR